MAYLPVQFAHTHLGLPSPRTLALKFTTYHLLPRLHSRQRRQAEQHENRHHWNPKPLGVPKRLQSHIMQCGRSHTVEVAHAYSRKAPRIVSGQLERPRRPSVAISRETALVSTPQALVVK